jgi:hypothetical protein
MNDNEINNLNKFLSNGDFFDLSHCWNWNKSKDASGYGQCWFNSKRQKSHRFIWELLHGDIPDKMYVCHSCDNTSCVNPYHLFLGTAKDNAVDKWLKGRQPHGKKAGGKFSDYQIRYIRELYVSGISQNKIAKMYKVIPSTISNIINYKSYRLV